MWKSSSLQDEYAQWLSIGHSDERQNIMKNFKAIAENFFRPEFKIDNKVIYLTSHAHFLMQALSSAKNQTKSSFHLIVLILNYILKIKPSIRIPLKIATITAINSYFQCSSQPLKSPHFISNILWLICRCLHSTHHKRTILAELDRSQLIVWLLNYAELDELAEKAMSMLLYYITKNKADKSQIIIKLLQNYHKFHHGESIKHILAILKDVGLVFYQNNKNAASLLANFLQQYILNQTITFSSKLENLQLILLVSIQNPNLIHKLKICQFIQNKLSAQTLKDEPLLQQLTKVLQLQKQQESTIKRYLSVGVQTLANNVVSRRLFIRFHEKLTQEQLINILTGQVLSTFSPQIDSHHQIQNALKLIICLKRSVVRLGLNPIFWYTCKPLIQKILNYGSQRLPAQSLDLFELFEQTLKEQIHFINYI